MFLTSLRSISYIFFGAIVLQLFAVMAGFYYQNQGDRLKNSYLATIKTEIVFLQTIAQETNGPISLASDIFVEERYQPVIHVIESENLHLNVALLTHRVKLMGELNIIKQEQEQLHHHLNSLLPNLSTGVRYINDHHIAYLKNLLQRGKLVQDYDTGESFERSPVRSASELDMIHAATAIQFRMLETFEVFSRLQGGYSPKAVLEDFTHHINAFYAAINTFEDYSLDAQDGLLVEELLFNAQTFEDSYKRFIFLEQRFSDLVGILNENRDEFIGSVHDFQDEIENEVREFDRLILIIRYLMLLVNILLLGTLFFLAIRVKSAFQRTITETKRLQDSRSYYIPHRKNDFTEFGFVYKALNTMTDMIRHQVRALEASQAQLEERVRLRTQELSATNDKLLREIREKIRHEQERRALQDKLVRAQKMEAIGTLAGGVAHDLNNILSGIVSYPDLILMDLPEKSDLRDPLQTIKESGEKAAIIVQDLLTLARRGVSQHVPVALNKVVEAFLNSPEYEKIISRIPGIRVNVQLSPDSGIINGSPIHLTRILINLVSNGADAIADGGTITILTAKCYIDTELHGYDNVAEGEYVQLSVTDTGAGMSPDVLKRIFEPFFTTKSMGRSGSGLGMAVVWGTVKDHNGFVNVKSKEGEGTTFDLYFPMCRELSESDQVEMKMTTEKGNGETVLVIDDVAEQRSIACMMLNHLGYSAKAVGSGEEALAHIRHSPVDILLLDMIMPPGMDGLETYRQIAGIRPGQKAVIASGYSENKKVAEAQRLGAGPYIQKPYKMIELAAMVRFELDKYRS